METRAHHILVGAFVLAILAGLFGFVIWLAKIEIDREFSRYLVFFEGSVSGLTTASSVLYNGIPVGTVMDIKLDPDDPSRVRVIIEVNADTPIRSDSVATLEMQGITGVSLVQLSGGSLGSPVPVARPGERLPEINSAPSQFQRIFAGAPELLKRATVLIEQFTGLVSQDNVQIFSDILADAQAVSGQLGARSEDLGSILDNFEKTSTEIRQAAESLNDLIVGLDTQVAIIADGVEATMSTARGTLSGVDTMVDSQLRTLLDQAEEMARSISEASESLSQVVTDTRQPLADFSAEGLYEFTGLIADMRQLMGSLSRLTGQIESDPAQFLFGNAQRGFEAE
jgi:phospholipid/cholesterol/gamma-HCH transport system substrate-binding protein